MEELNDMFINRAMVSNVLSDAVKLKVQNDDGNGNIIPIEEQIENAKNNDELE